MSMVMLFLEHILMLFLVIKVQKVFWLRVSLLSALFSQQVAGPCAHITQHDSKEKLHRSSEHSLGKKRGGEVDLTVLPSTLSHYSGACC